MALNNHIKRVQDKLQQLVKQYQLLQKDNARMKEEVKKLQELKDSQAEQIEGLKQQVGILRSAAGQMNEADKRSFEKNINQYIKEIDKCIALLSE